MGTYIELSVVNNDKDSKIKVGDHMRLSKNFFFFCKRLHCSYCTMLSMISMVKKLLKQFLKKARQQILGLKK